MFRKVTGRKCGSPDCEYRGQVVSARLSLCETCGTKLDDVSVLNRPLAAGAIAAAVVLALAAIFAAKAYIVRLAVEKEAELIAQAQAAARQALAGETREGAGRIMSEIAKRFELSESQRASLVTSMSPDMARLPNDLNESLMKQLSALVRAGIEDGVSLTADEPRVAGFIKEHSLSRARVEIALKDATERAAAAVPAIAEGKRLASAGRLPEAYEAFRKATEKDADNAFAWANRGAAAAVLGNRDEAHRSYERALSIDPVNWLAHYNSGLLYAREANREKALMHLGDAIVELRRGQRARGELQAVLSSMESDEALKQLRSDPRYVQMVETSR